MIRTPGRILVASEDVAKPISVNSVIDVAPGPMQFNARAGWIDLGATRGGITFTRNIAEDGYQLDNDGLISTQRSISGVEISTNLADMNLDTFAKVWDQSVQQVGPTERRIGGSMLPTPKYNRLVLMHPVYSAGTTTDADKTQRASVGISAIRAYVVNLAEVAPEASSLTFAKSGDQQTLSIKWRALPDPEEMDVRQRFFYILERTV